MELSVLVGVLIGMMGLAIKFWPSLIHFQERQRLPDPDIRAETFKRSMKPAHPGSDFEALQVNFHLSFDSSKWLVYEVYTGSRQSRWIAVLQGGRREGPWTNSIRYDPPVISESFLLHPDAPKQPRLSFYTCLRSHVRIRRKVEVIPTEGSTIVAY